jgi:SAM-dependent methyltransferase
MNLYYDLVENFPGWNLAQDYFKSLLLEYNCRRILEVGSGANPTLPPSFVRTSGLSYVTSDLDHEEMEKADHAFERLVLDMSSKSIDPALSESFDCIWSRMVGEHIRDGHQYHRNIYTLLRPGGISAHCFSTLWTVPFAVNRLLPDNLTSFLQHTFGPRDEYRNNKFKAYYSWSRGPSKAMIRRYERIGFEVVSYGGYFGHNYYLEKLPALHQLELLKSKLLLECPVPQLCSYATLVLRKPDRTSVHA